MSGIGKIKKITGNQFLSYYELEAIRRDGGAMPYYMASRNSDPNTMKAITHRNHPDGVIIYSLLGDSVVLVRQFRYPIGDYIYELPAGLVEPGENVTDAAIREMYEETGLTLSPIPNSFRHPFFTSVGMTDESCSLVCGWSQGTPSNIHQECSEDIQVILADRAECRRILETENVALPCAFMLMNYLSSENDPFLFLK